MARSTHIVSGSPLPRSLRLCRVDRGPWRELYLTGTVDAPAADALLEWPGLASLGAGHVRLFGPSTRPLADGLRSLAGERLSVCRFRVPPPGASPAPGLQLFGVEPGPEATLSRRELDGAAVGWTLTAPDRRLGFVSQVARPHADPAAAYEQTYAATLEALDSLGFGPAHLVRTWCHFRDVLTRYGEFNDVRRRLFAQHHIGPELPASTGIQGLADDGSPLVMDALAAQGAGLARQTWSNPAQQEAPAYGSLFSRAVRLRGAGPEQVIVSGMAAIGAAGESLHPDDPAAQLETTVRHLRTLLDSAGCSLADVVTATAYLHPAHVDALAAALETSPLAGVPLAVTAGRVCRPELLFEVEAMAFVAPEAAHGT